MTTDNNSKPLGFWMCTALVIGNTIGIGVFMMPAALAPYGLNAFTGWTVTLLGCIFIAHVFANFARSMPDEDGPYGYTRRAFGNGAAFFIMWCYWVSIWITNATIAIGIVGYSSAIFPGLAAHAGWQPLVALALIWFFVVINIRGAHVSGWVQVATTVLKLLPMLAVMLVGGWLLLTEPALYSAHIPATPVDFESTRAAGTIALFAMLGIECATVPAGKVHDAERTIPRATMFGTVVTAAIYIGVSAIPILLIPQQQLAQSNAPFADLFNHFLSPGSGQWLALFVIISGLGALNGWTLMAGEVTVAFANNGVFPAAFAKNNRYGAPALSLVVMGIFASAMIVMNYSRSLAQGFTFLSVVVTAANLPLYLIGGIALIKLWREGQIKTLGNKHYLLMVSAIMSTAFSVWAFTGVGQESFWWALALGGVSLPVFYARRWWLSRTTTSAELTE